MIPLRVVVLHVLAKGILERASTKEDHAVEALVLQAAKPSLHVDVQVGALWWKQNNFGVSVLLQEFPHSDEVVVAICDQMAGVLQKAILIVGQTAAHLRHPHGVGARCYPRDVHATGLQVHHGEDVERDETVSRPDFQSCEVCGKDGIPVSSQKR